MSHPHSDTIPAPGRQSTQPLDAATLSLYFQTALNAHRAGSLVEAEDGYRRILALREDHADSYHMLAILQQQQGNFGEAEQLIRRALAIREDPAILGNFGKFLFEAGRGAEAEQIYRRAVQLKPDFAEAHYMLGVLSHAKEGLDEAEAAYKRALNLNPGHPFAHYDLSRLLAAQGRLAEAETALRSALALRPDFAPISNDLGNVLYQTGRRSEAEALYRRALALNPDDANAHYNLANLLRDDKRRREAEESYGRALALRADFAEAHNNFGNLLQETKRMTEAEAAYRRTLALSPDFASAHYNLGKVLQATKRLSEAESCFRRALELWPDSVDTYNNLGLLLHELKRLDEAESAYRRALALQPENSDIYNNLGNLLKETSRIDESEAAYRLSLRLDPTNAITFYNLGLLLLGLGRLEEAWFFHDYYYQVPIQKSLDGVFGPPYRLWRGESLEGKSLLIWPEHGYGDYIQCARYVPMLKKRGVSKLTLVCAPALEPLLETVQGVDAIVTDPASVAAVDYWTFPLNLPLRFGTSLQTVPDRQPYLQAAPARLERWRGRLSCEGRKVGLVWKGNAINLNDCNRSLPNLATLAPLWDVPGVNFFSLQKGQGEEEAQQAAAAGKLVALGNEIADFADTAAIVAQLDLLICVDTAAAHVAGALGKPCWVLLPKFGTDWRWLMDRTDSPWYPQGMRLFRQTDLSDWSATVEAVRAALQEWMTA